ncbi:hypothetical protein EMPS_05267 [Entomortierella parvispora]|uniref:RRM domain-containing protein n=1 Tax=Entomortierella parvispora TaxID=205924 RepID=A0A9P3LWC4_9FUNG|nr:hypothetical protein EMPS_05267 [Entomortierella parvispora]
MNRIDQSLDDIIKMQKQEKKKATSSAKGASAAKSTKNTIPKKVAGGVKSRAAIRTERAIRTSKPNSPYAKPTTAKKETALFTASYQAAKAPVKEIFTAGYIAKPKGTLKLYTTNYKAGLKAGAQQQQQQQRQASGPLTSKPVRLVTTQQVRKDPRAPASLTSLHTRNERIPTGPRNPEPVSYSGGRHNDRRQDDVFADRRSAHGNQNGSLSNRHGSSSNNNHGHGSNSQRNANGPSDRNARRESSPRIQLTTKAQTPVLVQDEDMDVDMGDTPIAIRGSAPGTNVAFRGESGPVTVEIENLDPETTADDVKYVCSRFGEIKSCVCTHGFSQVTYARKAAGLAAIENLNGKKADNGKILRVTMRANAIIHQEPAAPVAHIPSAIAGPMKILTKAVQGTMTNAGTLYSDQLLAAQQMLKVQQHRMAQLAHEEQRISSLRSQSNPQLSNLTSLSSSGVNRGFF